MDKKDIFIIAILITVLLVGAYFYPQLPDQLASHWNASGQVDGYMSKFWGVFLIPIISIAVYLIFIAIPFIAPNREKIRKFKHYFTLKLATVAFLAILYIYTIMFNLGYALSINTIMPVLLGGLFIVLGYIIKDVKKNYFIGIRTPWTLADETTWRKTHKFGSKTFMITGIISIISAIVPEKSFMISIIAIISGALIPVAYSYFAFKRIKW